MWMFIIHGKIQQLIFFPSFNYMLVYTMTFPKKFLFYCLFLFIIQRIRKRELKFKLIA